MTRPRSSAPGRDRPARRRSLSWLLLPVLAMFLVAACIGQDELQDEPSPTPTATGTAPVATDEPAQTPSPDATAAPTPAATAVPTPVPTAPPASDAPSPSGGAGSIEACTGTEDNRAFYAGAADSFAWPVYCAVLPARWFVEAGEYKSAGGGWLEITYRGPGGARFELHEGAFCDDADGCVPDGADAGTAAFGDLSGTLVDGADGRFAIVVDRGADRSWLAIGDGLDVEVFKGFAADLALVE